MITLQSLYSLSLLLLSKLGLLCLFLDSTSGTDIIPKKSEWLIDYIFFLKIINNNYDATPTTLAAGQLLLRPSSNLSMSM